MDKDIFSHMVLDKLEKSEVKKLDLTIAFIIVDVLIFLWKNCRKTPEEYKKMAARPNLKEKFWLKYYIWKAVRRHRYNLSSPTSVSADEYVSVNQSKVADAILDSVNDLTVQQIDGLAKSLEEV